MARHLATIDRALTDIATGKNDRLIIQLPPRHGKSTLLSQYFPAWYLGTYPHRNVMLVGATGDLAKRFSIRARETLEAFGPIAFGRSLHRIQRAWNHWRLAGAESDQGEVFAAGVGGGGIMGAGCHLLIIDDYHRNVEDALSDTIRRKQQEWLLSTSASRLEPGGAMIICGTRWHRDDLIGFVRANEELGARPWRVISFPAISQAGESLWPERWPLEELEAIRRERELSGYPWMWQALYQQDPPSVLDAEWDGDWFSLEKYGFDAWPDDLQFRIAALDPSLGATDRADLSAYVILGVAQDGTLYVEADLARRDAYQIVSDGIEIANRHQLAALGIESNGFQAVLGAIFNRESTRHGFPTPIHLMNNHVAKLVRIRAGVTPYLTTGKFRWRRRSGGTSLLLEQLRGFPSHSHDDGPDALEMAIRMARHIFSTGLETTPERSVVIPGGEF